MARFFSEQPPCLVGIEGSGSAHYWARVFNGLGHTVRLMAPQLVKPEELNGVLVSASVRIRD